MCTKSTQSDQERLQPKPAGTADLRLRNLVAHADSLVSSLGATLPVDQLPPAAALRLHAGQRLVESAHYGEDRLGYALMLEALASAPEAVTQAIRALRAELVATDPLLAALQ